MKVGDLIVMRGASQGSPNGLIVESTISCDGGYWFDILWDDGTISGAWSSELRCVT